VKGIFGVLVACGVGFIPAMGTAQTFNTFSPYGLSGAGVTPVYGSGVNDTMVNVLSGRQSLPQAYQNMVTGQDGQSDGQSSAGGSGKKRSAAPPAANGTLKSLVAAAPAAPGRSPMAYSTTGRAHAHDALTLVFENHVVVLSQLEAPGLEGVCKSGGNGYTWACGQDARDFLEDLLERGPVTCEVIGSHGTCQTYDGSDLGGQLVAAGYAYANSGNYAGPSRVARTSRVGIWIGEAQ